MGGFLLPFSRTKLISKICPLNLVQIRKRSKIKSIEQYWSDLIGVPLSQFGKPFFQTSSSKVSLVDPNFKGLLRVRVSHTRELFITILGWLEALKSHI